MKIFICGEISESADLELLNDTLNNLGLEYKISKFTNQIYINKPFILQETLNYRPDCIVCLGSKALNVYINEAFEDKISALRKQEFNFNDIPVRLTYNPKYINRMGGARTKEYLGWQNDFRQWSQQYSDNYKEENFPTLLFEQDQILDYVKTFINAKAYDVEGSSLSPLVLDFRLGGVGLTTEDTSGYLLIRDYTNPGGELQDNVRQKLRGLLQHLSNNKCCVFNAGYEYAVTLSQFGIKTSYLDVYMYGKTLDKSGGLKDQSQYELGVRGWTNEIDEAISLLEIILKCYKPTNTVKGLRDKKEYTLLVEEGIKSSIEAITNKKIKSVDELSRTFNRWLEITTELYRSEELAYQYLENWIKYKHDVNDWGEVRYIDIPAWSYDENGNKVSAMLSKYCCLDCVYTLRLKDKYEAEIKEKNLVHAAEVYNRQMEFANELETTGFKWDDIKAEEIKNEYLITATDALRNFLLVPRTKSVLEINSVQEIEILSATSIDQLKKYFNPDSTAPENTKILSTILSTDKIKMVMMFNKLLFDHQQINSKVVEKYPLLMKLIQSFNKENLPDNYVVLVIKSIIQANNNQTLNLDEQAILGQYANWRLPDATSETIESIANAAAKFLGVNLDKEETWTEDYKLIFYYKLFKKVSKAISAFIDGRNGRKAVKIVTREKQHGYHNRVSEYRSITEDDLDIDYIREQLSQYSMSDIALN